VQVKSALLRAKKDKARADGDADAARKDAETVRRDLAAGRRKQKRQASLIAKLKDELHAVKTNPHERSPQNDNILDAVRAAATKQKEVMVAVADLRAVLTMLPLLLLRFAQRIRRLSHVRRACMDTQVLFSKIRQTSLGNRHHLIVLITCSMRLVPIKDISQHLVVEVNSAPALQVNLGVARRKRYMQMYL
jgi:hypothetical protein